MIVSEIITTEFSDNLDMFLNRQYSNLLRWAIVRVLCNNMVVVNLSYVKDFKSSVH